MLQRAMKRTEHFETQKLHLRKVFESANQGRHACRTNIVAVKNNRVKTRHHGRRKVELEDVDEGPALRKHLGEKLRTLVAHVHI